MFEVSPMKYIGMKASSTDTGIVTMGMTADGVALTIEIGDAAADVRTQCDLRYLSDQHGRAGLLVDRDDDVLEVLNRPNVASAPHHELGPRKLEDPASHLVVPLADGINQPRLRNLVGKEQVRVGVDLVLLDEATNGRHLRDAGH